MHILANRVREEFLSVPHLVRFDMANSDIGREPALLVKTRTLTIKYAIKSNRFSLIVFRLTSGSVGYAIKVYDDPEKSVILWSVVEHQNEIDAIRSIANGGPCPVYLFNELAVNLVWGLANKFSSQSDLNGLLDNVTFCVDSALVVDEVVALLDTWKGNQCGSANYFCFGEFSIDEWREIQSIYVTNRLGRSNLSVISEQEGAQQEELALWLIDALSLQGAIKNPQVVEDGGTRELADLLMTYEKGAFLVESKGLNILDRGILPGRDRLASSVIGKVKKAVSQLKGGCKNIGRGLRLLDERGDEIQIASVAAPHAIVLVPDLGLLDDSEVASGALLREFAQEAGGYLHILDPTELLRVVQSAHTISGMSKAVTLMMAFDYYLIERFKKAIESNRANFEMILRVSEN